MRKIILGVTALAVAVTALATAAPALAGGKPPSRSWSTCQPYFRRTISGPWGAYIVRDDVFTIPGQPSPTVCISHKKGQPTFTVTKSTADSSGPSVAYPEVFYGCVYGACSPGSVLPMAVSKLPRSFRFSAYDRLTAKWRKGKFDTGFDIWFSTSRSTGGQATGAEIMIWLTDRGVRFTPEWTVTIDGIRWLAEEWKTVHPNGLSWPLIIFLRQKPSGYCHRLHLSPFVRFGEQRKWIARTDWLESVEHGYEIWQGGSHLATTFFRVIP
jgi:hypothetical protein